MTTHTIMNLSGRQFCSVVSTDDGVREARLGRGMFHHVTPEQLATLRTGPTFRQAEYDHEVMVFTADGEWGSFPAIEIHDIARRCHDLGALALMRDLEHALGDKRRPSVLATIYQAIADEREESGMSGSRSARQARKWARAALAETIVTKLDGANPWHAGIGTPAVESDR